MMRWIGLVAAVAFWPAAADAGEAVDAIKAHCAEKWGSDFRMQDYCREKEIQALRDFGSYIDDNFSKEQIIEDEAEAGDPRAQIILRCNSKWNPQYSMIVYCIEQQEAALQRL